MNTVKFLSLALLASSLLSACSKDDDETIPVVVHEEEVITTMDISLVNGDNTITLKSYDADGEGPEAPVVTVSGDLTANTSYQGTITLLNETEEPAGNITEEVKEKGKIHQFFYLLENNLATFAYNDSDASGKPIGILFTLTTKDAGSDKLTVILRHEPNKDGENVSNGDITNANGSTDIEAAFDITIK